MSVVHPKSLELYNMWQLATKKPWNVKVARFDSHLTALKLISHLNSVWGFYNGHLIVTTLGLWCLNYS